MNLNQVKCDLLISGQKYESVWANTGLLFVKFGKEMTKTSWIQH